MQCCELGALSLVMMIWVGAEQLDWHLVPGLNIPGLSVDCLYFLHMFTWVLSKFISSYNPKTCRMDDCRLKINWMMGYCIIPKTKKIQFVCISCRISHPEWNPLPYRYAKHVFPSLIVSSVGFYRSRWRSVRKLHVAPADCTSSAAQLYSWKN